MKGLYKLGETKTANVITNYGKNLALDVLSGKTSSLVESIVVGIGTTPATANDQYLEFEVATVDVNSVIVDYVGQKIYYKGVLPANDHYLIGEIGCNANSSLSAVGGVGRSSGVIFNFNGFNQWIDPDGIWSNTTFQSRIDRYSIVYDINNETVTGYSFYAVDLSDLPVDTIVKFAYYTDDVDSLTLSFKVDDANYYSYSGWPVTDGYHISPITKGDFVATGNPDWSLISSVEVSATANTTATLSLDSIRYDYIRNNNSQLLSRAVLNTPKQKLSGVTMDIEYVLDINI